MIYKIVRARNFERDLEAFADYARDYSDKFAQDQFTRLDRAISFYIASSPTRWGWFFVTGAPYRGYLFKIGRRTQYWIVYFADEREQRIELLRFWNTSRNVQSFRI